MHACSTTKSRQVLVACPDLLAPLREEAGQLVVTIVNICDPPYSSGLNAASKYNKEKFTDKAFRIAQSRLLRNLKQHDIEYLWALFKGSIVTESKGGWGTGRESEVQ